MTTLKIFNNHIKICFIVLAVVESFAYFEAVYIAYAIRFQTLDFYSPDIMGADLVPKALVFAVANMLGMTALGLYQQDQFRGRVGYAHILSRVLVSLMLVFIALMVLFYLVPFFRLGRGITLLAFLISLVLVVAIRRLFVLYLGADLVTSKVLVFGVGRNAASLLIKDDGNLPTSSYRILGFISTPEQNRFVAEDKIIEIGDSLLTLARRLEVSEIVIALDDRNENYPVQHMLDCKLAGINVTDPISFLEREQGKVNLSHLNPSWLVFSEGFRGSRIKTALSRAFDVASSLLILVVTAPILALVTFLIAMEGGFKEPVLYRQQRVGKNGQVFDLLKFRSMRVDAEKMARNGPGRTTPGLPASAR